MNWTTPGALWLLAAVPVVWILLRFSRTNFNPRQRVLQAIVRSLILALLALALARPVISSGSSNVSVVYAVDVSDSVAMPSVLAAATQIDDLNATARPASFRIVAFGANAAVLPSTEALRKFVADGRSVTAGQTVKVDRRGTNLESALSVARASLAPGSLPRIVLFSDGRATSGDVAAETARLQLTGVPVSVVPLAIAGDDDAWIERVDLPVDVAAGASVSAHVTIGSRRSGSAVLEIRSGGKVLASRTITLASRVDVSLDFTLDSPGAQSIDLVMTTAGDPRPENNRLTRALNVSPKPRVLYMEGAPSEHARYLAAALSAGGMDVAIRTPAAWQGGLEPLDPWDVVILSDVSRAMLSDATQRGLAEWVEKQGGGLLIAGGESVFGEGPQGYRKTELERLAPVTFERRDEPEIALVIVLDKSYSMNGPVMELCKGAAQAAIDALTDPQSVGVISFNDSYAWDVTLRNVGKNREEIRKNVAAIEASGHTLIFPPVEQAFLALKGVKARAKHVVLLSDGRSYPDDYEGLVKKMVDAKITVSSIAVGPDADVELLGNIAKWGKGRSYTVLDAREVPQIFVKEAKDVPNLSFDEKSLTPVVTHQAFLEGVDLAHAPALRGRTATVMKDSALELVSTRDGDPLLAFWPIGLGRTAVFASDVKDRWAADWVQWRGYGPFFVSTVRALQRRRVPEMALRAEPGIARGTTRPIALIVDAHDPQGKPRDFLTPAIRVQSGSRPPVTLSARQTAPGRYEANVTVDADLPFAAVIDGSDAAVASALVVPDPQEELRFKPVDEVALRSIASATGGHWMPAGDSLAAKPGERRASRRPLWPSLLWSALGLWLVDLLMRRVRILEN